LFIFSFQIKKWRTINKAFIEAQRILLTINQSLFSLVIAIAVTTADDFASNRNVYFHVRPSITMMDLPILNSGMVMNLGKHLFKTILKHTKAFIYY
jgi:hypothetical protein